MIPDRPRSDDADFLADLDELVEAERQAVSLPVSLPPKKNGEKPAKKKRRKRQRPSWWDASTDVGWYIAAVYSSLGVIRWCFVLASLEAHRGTQADSIAGVTCFIAMAIHAGLAFGLWNQIAAARYGWLLLAALGSIGLAVFAATSAYARGAEGIVVLLALCNLSGCLLLLQDAAITLRQVTIAVVLMLVGQIGILAIVPPIA
jgi:hypothetical protein